MKIAKPDFLTGVAGIVDSAGALLEYDFSEESDAYAIAADWAVVGNDLEEVIIFDITSQSRVKNFGSINPM